jgi:nucleoid DNA-binding protein
MNKARLVSELSTQLSLTKNDTEERLAHLIDLMCQELKQQNTIQIPGLGQFETRERASYVAYNPHYKKKMRVPPKVIVQFTPTKAVKEELKGAGL